MYPPDLAVHFTFSFDLQMSIIYYFFAFKVASSFPTMASAFFTASLIAILAFGRSPNFSSFLIGISFVKITISASFTSSAVISFSIPIDPWVSTFTSIPLSLHAFSIAAGVAVHVVLCKLLKKDVSETEQPSDSDDDDVEIDLEF